MDLKAQKERLINELIDLGYLKTEAVINAFRKVPREEFVLPGHRDYAYANDALPIMEGQTISQPLTVAAMTEALDVRLGQKVLEVGTGSGYQAAILSVLVGRKGSVITTERIKALHELAKRTLGMCGFVNIVAVNCDGSQGYEKIAPYDRIIVTASASKMPQPLAKQLKVGGKLVIPIKNELFLIEKVSAKEFTKTFLGYYVFVPLIGKYGNQK